MNTWTNIQRLMDSAGIGKRQLADLCGVQPSSVTKWARGGKISPAYLSKIALHYGVSVDSLLGHEPMCVKESSTVHNVNRKTLSATDAARYNFESALRSATAHPEGDRAVHWLGTMLLMLASGIENKNGEVTEPIVFDIVSKLLKSAKGEKV